MAAADEASFVAALLPIIFALFSAIFSSEEGNREGYVDPALQPLSETADQFQCGRCYSFIAYPYVSLSLQRKDIIQMLSFVNIALLVTLYYVATKGGISPIAVGTYLVTCAAFLALLMIAIRRRDVFFWWRNRWTRLLTILFLAVVTVVARIAPESLNAFDATLFVTRTLSWRLEWSVLVVIIFLISSILSTHSYKSIRRRILEHLDDHPDGCSYERWLELLTPKQPRLLSRLLGFLKRLIGARPLKEEILLQLQKQVYQGAINVRLSERSQQAQMIFYRRIPGRATSNPEL